ncbi:MAG: hypothetical protein H5T45_03480 [Thermoplasmatales archaeon]|nr:hypothetical protein [Thermoplasmatales archaeon]
MEMAAQIREYIGNSISDNILIVFSLNQKPERFHGKFPSVAITDGDTRNYVEKIIETIKARDMDPSDLLQC